MYIQTPPQSPAGHFVLAYIEPPQFLPPTRIPSAHQPLPPGYAPLPPSNWIPARRVDETSTVQEANFGEKNSIDERDIVQIDQLKIHIEFESLLLQETHHATDSFYF